MGNMSNRLGRRDAEAAASGPAELGVLGLHSAAAVLTPERRRLVEALQQSADSAAGLARRLGERRQRLNYHLRVLESAGVLELAEERRRGNRTERVLRVAAHRFVVDPSVLGSLAAEPERAGDRFSATWLIALAARAIRELARLRERASSESKRLATVGMEAEVRLARPADFEAFVADLGAAIGGVVARHQSSDPAARPFRVVAGSYPAPAGETAQAGGDE